MPTSARIRIYTPLNNNLSSIAICFTYKLYQKQYFYNCLQNKIGGFFIKKIKIVSLMLCGGLLLSSCGIGKKPLYGTYKTVGVFEDTFTLNENQSYDATGTTPQIETTPKGTYSETENGFKFNNSSSFLYTDFIKIGDFYCNNNSCFTADTEYGLSPSFDENGRSNQTFNYQMINGLILPNPHHEFTLSLKDDGTCTAKFEVTQVWGIGSGNVWADLANMRTEYLMDKEISGTYELKDSVLYITYDDKVYPMPIYNNEIYFYTLERVEQEN